MAGGTGGYGAQGAGNAPGGSGGSEEFGTAATGGGYNTVLLGGDGGGGGGGGAAGGGAGGQGNFGGGGGGEGGANGATEVTTLTAGSTIAGGIGIGGGIGGDSGDRYGGGGGGGGEGGYGAVLQAGQSGTVAATVEGGSGGQGGASGIDSLGGAGGDGGLGIFVQSTASSSTTALDVTGSVTGGDGGAAGASQNGGSAANGAGGAGIVGANLAITNTGTIAGGQSGDPEFKIQADAIDFTGGTNSLTLSATTGGNTTTGTITGNIEVGGSLTVDPGTAAGTAVTLGNIITDYTNLTTFDTTAGSLTKVGAGTLVLSGANQYSGGTTIEAGTLDLTGPTVLDEGTVASGSAGTGGIAFSAPTGATLAIAQAAFPTNNGAQTTFGNIISGFAAPQNGTGGDTIDLTGLTGGVATFDYTTDQLTVTGAVNGIPTTDSMTLSGSYAGDLFTTAADGSGGTDITLTQVTAPTLSLANDTGVSNTDRITDNDALTGTTVAGTVVTFTEGSTTLGTTTANINGVFNFTPTGLAQGNQTITASETVANTPEATSLAFDYDTVAPTITAIADSGTGISANGSGDLNAGKVVTLTVTNSEPVYVSGGTPTLTLNDGGTATYTGGSGTTTLTFSYTVAAGQNTAKLAVTTVNANGAIVTDAAGNPISTRLAGATVPSGTLEIDTTAPTASSPTLTVAQNASATPIGIAAPSDNLTAAGSLAIVATSLPTDGAVTLADGTTRVTAGESLTAAQLTGLEFTPTAGAYAQGSTFSYTVTDGAGNATTGKAALNVGSPGAPTITGTHATATTSEAAVTPFSGVTVADPSAATETLTIALTGAGGTLRGTGLTANTNGTYQLAGTAAAVTAELDGLSFTPTAGAAGTTSATTFVLTDSSSAGTSVTNAGTSVTDTDPATTPVTPPVVPTAPTFSGTHASTTTAEAAVQPFAGVAVTDNNAGATDSLLIRLAGAGGTLTGNGLVSNANGSYSLAAASAGTITAELDTLSFTPTAGAAGTQSTTTFLLQDTSSAGPTGLDGATSVTDTAAPAPTPTPTPVAPDAVSFSPQVTYANGVFALTGTATSAAGVSNVELLATLDDGSVSDLGAATVNANGTFVFSDDVGFAAGTQGFITAVETDGAGVSTSALASYSLTAGLDTSDGSRAPFVAEQDVYNADGSALTAVSDFRADGSASNDASRRTTIMTPDQTVVSDQFDDYKNGGQPDTTFVFNPNHGLDTISLFRVGGADHDTLSFKGSDFGNSIAAVLNDTHQTSGGASVIVDPVTGDAVKLAGITKAQIAANQGDVTFHA